ncbi:hypothetical protein F5X98DRAFT_339571 [Xylaria grammica]|nr:hypothetical protein F5X98DRAFT_339571 [Xylaria grammica]
MAALFPPLPVDSLSRLLPLSPRNINEALADHHTIILNIPNRTTRPIRLHYPTFRDFLLNRTGVLIQIPRSTRGRHIGRWLTTVYSSC